MILIMFRQRKKDGGRIEDVLVSEEIASKIPNRWEFCSKLDIPKKYKQEFTMAYNTKDNYLKIEMIFKKIMTITRKGLFNITDEYDVYKDAEGYYGICRKNEEIPHCAYKSLEAAIKSKRATTCK